MTSAYLDDVAARAGEPCTVCPPKALQCAHFDGYCVWLGDRSVGSQHECGMKRSRYVVATGSELGDTAISCRCRVQTLVRYGGERPFNTDDLATAQAEFDLRAEALRQGAA